MSPSLAPATTGIDALTAWLDETAEGLDDGSVPASTVLPALGAAGVLAIGAGPFGGEGDIADAVEAVAGVSAHSLAAGFVFWSQRTYLEYLLQSPNAALRDRLAPDLVSGRLAGATGLSNAMKFLSGLEELQIRARADRGAIVFDGRMPWVTNLRPEGFHVAGVAEGEDGRILCVSFAGDDEGLVRSPDLGLMGLRSTNTAALSVASVRLDAERVIHPDAAGWLPQVRPAFLGLQCGMSIGLARRSLREAREAIGAGRSVLAPAIAELETRLAADAEALRSGLRSGLFRGQAAALFRIRIGLAAIAAEAVALELQASGGRAYLTAFGSGFARRYREAAFIPVITPSLVQLKGALTPHDQGAA
ncbi:acyl-CoA dehydrogenase family protein [Enterovirga rhinocerotis]|uniref:Alkylation response protein AidB-like acyl-CoA dehydrogenase n=1 Tax=Enterovirga rhinocerotis TaxID=1339210 RepID=A0A4R7C3F2_9HYPH|nr:acyl-CoA dehydrogenase family protein [Enterovirga rhinocerotis]TDR92964.1 hypothetical protein EV668_0208 [Enterovirga rhinocerotis]